MVMIMMEMLLFMFQQQWKMMILKMEKLNIVTEINYIR